MRHFIGAVALASASLFSVQASAADRSSAPEDAYVYFISPAHGETVHSPVLVRFGLGNMGVAPAGVERSQTGHHHLLIDMDELPAADEPMPASDQLKHFGKGQTEALIELSPGKHTLQLVMGNYAHVMHKPIIKSKQITIEVLAPEADDDNGGKGKGLGLLR